MRVISFPHLVDLTDISDLNAFRVRKKNKITRQEEPNIHRSVPLGVKDINHGECVRNNGH